MKEHVDALLAYWAEHRAQMRQSEDQRSALTNYILVIVAALTGFVVQQKLTAQTLPVTLLIVLIGVYGALSTAKYHERATYHLSQARALTRTLEEAGALPSDERLREYRTKHYRKYPRLHRLRLHWLWTGLHLAIAGYGIALTITALTR